MSARVYWIAGLSLLMAVAVNAQVEPAATDGAPGQEDSSQMRTPPPVSDEAYPVATRSEMRSNYLRAGLTFDTAYDDNVVPYYGTVPKSDFVYSIRPTIALDQTTPRLHQMLTYSPGFTIYQRTSARNEAGQNAAASVQYQFSPHGAVSLRDSFLKSSNTFNQINAGVTGLPLPWTDGAIPPIADRQNNSASGEVTYQFSKNGMLGGGGSLAKLTFPKLSEVPGLCDSSSHGGSVFYNLRLTGSQYAGVTYQFENSVACPAVQQSRTQTHTLNFFYSLYLMRSLSLSLSGGPQHFDSLMLPFPSSSAWTPAITASTGWQSGHVSLAANYSRTVNGGGGLFGAYHSNSATGQARWQLARYWSLESQGSYEIHKTVNSLFVSSSAGGHTVCQLSAL